MRCDGLVAEVQDWAAGLEEVHARIAGRFARAEPRARVLTYLRGLLGQLERKNGWTLAEAGEVSPDGMQRLLRTADWNADSARNLPRRTRSSSRYMPAEMSRGLPSKLGSRSLRMKALVIRLLLGILFGLAAGLFLCALCLLAHALCVVLKVSSHVVSLSFA